MELNFVENEIRQVPAAGNGKWNAPWILPMKNKITFLSFGSVPMRMWESRHIGHLLLDKKRRTMTSKSSRRFGPSQCRPFGTRWRVLLNTVPHARESDTFVSAAVKGKTRWMIYLVTTPTAGRWSCSIPTGKRFSSPVQFTLTFKCHDLLKRKRCVSLTWLTCSTNF